MKKTGAVDQYGEWLEHLPCKAMPTTRRSSLGNELCLWILPSTLCSNSRAPVAQSVRAWFKSWLDLIVFSWHILQYQVILMFIVTESRCSDNTVEPSLMETPQQWTATRYNRQF